MTACGFVTNQQLWFKNPVMRNCQCTGALTINQLIVHCVEKAFKEGCIQHMDCLKYIENALMLGHNRNKYLAEVQDCTSQFVFQGHQHDDYEVIENTHEYEEGEGFNNDEDEEGQVSNNDENETGEQAEEETIKAGDMEVN